VCPQQGIGAELGQGQRLPPEAESFLASGYLKEKASFSYFRTLAYSKNTLVYGYRDNDNSLHL